MQISNMRRNRYVIFAYLLFTVILWVQLHSFLGKQVVLYLTGITGTVQMILREVLIPYGICFPVVYLMIRSIPKEKLQASQKASAGGVLKCFVVQTGIGMPVLFVATAIAMSLTNGAPNDAANQMMKHWPYYAVLLLMIHPVMEEIIFRKLMLERLLPYSRVFAVVASSLIFAVPHAFSGGIPRVLYTFILGCVWADMTIRHGNIWPAVILHSLSNLWGMFVPEIMTALGVGIQPFLLVSCALMPIASLVIILRHRLKNRQMSQVR